MEGTCRPSNILLQWHITERCNLRCAHCYQDSFTGGELGFAGLLSVLDQFKELLASWNRQKGATPVKGHVTVTGGEPFLRPDFMDLLEIFHAHRDLFSFAILSNGTLIDRTTAARLARLRPKFVQVSVEGGRATHDRIRGKGSFEAAEAALRRLVGAGVRTFVSFTAHRDNYREFPDVAESARRLKVARVWADRFIPPATASSPAPDSPAVLSPAETFRFFQLMQQARDEVRRRCRFSWKRTEVTMQRGLQFLAGGGVPYRCTAGDSLIAILPDGTLYPCRRMPIRAGNVLETPLCEIYHESEILNALRDRDRTAEGCRGCFFAKVCRGGLRCLSHALTGSPFETDPGCPLARPAT